MIAMRRRGVKGGGKREGAQFSINLNCKMCIPSAASKYYKIFAKF